MVWNTKGMLAVTNKALKEYEKPVPQKKFIFVVVVEVNENPVKVTDPEMMGDWDDDEIVTTHDEVSKFVLDALSEGLCSTDDPIICKENLLRITVRKVEN